MKKKELKGSFSRLWTMKTLEAIDKTGRVIYISKERWDHIQEHPGMSGQLEQIKETLKQPTTIIPFEFDQNVRFYYRYYKEKKEYLFVSVKYLNGNGFVITSFYVDKLK